MPPLDGYTVIDLSVGIAGAYCSKLLADGGATVVKVETAEGDPLRRWSASGAEIEPGKDGALFSFLAGSKHSVVVESDKSQDIALLRTSFATVPSERARASIMEVIAQHGTAADTQWLLDIARDANQSVDTRRRALDLVAHSTNGATKALALYDTMNDPTLKEALIRIYGQSNVTIVHSTINGAVQQGGGVAIRQGAGAAGGTLASLVVRASTISGNSVTISWTTTIPGAAVVRYGNANGPADSYPNQAAAGSGTRDTEKLHRIDPEVIKKEIVAAGFELVEESKLLANPADDHTWGPFTQGKRGTTDQSVFKFRKPAK